MTSLFVFDFDGVLFDTARECLEIAYQTARARPAELAFVERWRDLAEPPSDVAEAFARLRYLVGPPWQYAVLLEMISARHVPASTAAFLEVCAQRRDALGFFTDAYFAYRARLIGERRWLDLARPVALATRAFVELHACGRAAILSTRDDRSIAALVEHHLGVKLHASDLLPRAGSREKWEVLVEAAAQRGLAASRVFFADDYLPHALPAHRHGISAHLALWGYLGPDDTAHASKAGLPCLQLTDLDHALRAHEENCS